MSHAELPAHVDIRDVSLRDGLQIERPIPLSTKLELLAAVAATGLGRAAGTEDPDHYEKAFAFCDLCGEN